MYSQLATENYKDTNALLDSIVGVDLFDEMENFHPLSDEVVDLTEILMAATPRLSIWEAQELAERMLAVFGRK